MSPRNCSYAFLRILFLAGFLIVQAQGAFAQVVYSMGVTEIWDDNVFLEDDLDTPLDPGTAGPGETVTKYNDGDVNDDLITNVYLQASSAPRLSRYFTSSFDARVGGIFFDKESSENRMTLDSLIRLETEELLLPRPWAAYVSSRFDSNSSNLTAAQGTAARQAQTHVAELGVTSGDHQIATSTRMRGSYALARHDFLGEWTSNSDEDEAAREASGFDLQGSDYFENRFNLNFTRALSQSTEVYFDNTLSYLSFTNAEGNVNSAIETTDDFSASDLDRLDYTPSVGATYAHSENLVLDGRVGMDLTFYTEDPGVITTTVLNPDGTTSIIETERDSSESSLFFGGGLNYMLTQNTSLMLNALQSAGTDIDGQRILVRTFSANASHLFTERFMVTLGSQYSEYTTGDDLNDAIDRFEALAALRYAITDTVAIQLGYNYAKQDGNQADELNQLSVFGNDDYEVQRVFISLDTGVVALPGKM